MLDASGLVVALLDGSAGPLRERLAGEPVHAPHLIDAEVGNVLRRRVLRGVLDAEDGAALLGAGAGLVDHRYATTGALADGAWALRDNATFYDALYLALALALGIPLLTADRRLASLGLPGCTVELVPGS